MTTTVNPIGFLVVLKDARVKACREGSAPKYSGVDRVPPYPSELDAECQAMDEYVFGDVKDQVTNLIPTLARARSLLANLAGSPRSFEIIACCGEPADLDSLEGCQVKQLGYDIATITGDYWSIVDDFSPSAWARSLGTRLNEFGLFPSRDDAETYLQQYRAHQEPDYDAPFRVVFVADVTPR